MFSRGPARDAASERERNRSGYRSVRRLVGPDASGLDSLVQSVARACDEEPACFRAAQRARDLGCSAVSCCIHMRQRHRHHCWAPRSSLNLQQSQQPASEAALPSRGREQERELRAPGLSGCTATASLPVLREIPALVSIRSFARRAEHGSVSGIPTPCAPYFLVPPPSPSRHCEPSLKSPRWWAWSANRIALPAVV